MSNSASHSSEPTASVNVSPGFEDTAIVPCPGTGSLYSFTGGVGFLSVVGDDSGFGAGGSGPVKEITPAAGRCEAIVKALVAPVSSPWELHSRLSEPAVGALVGSV